jgi:hypothetical protein
VIKNRAAAWNLENELQSKLHDSRIMRIGCREEIARAEGPSYMVELRVIKGVEGFPAEFNRRRFSDRETLEKSHIEIGAVGPV